MTREQMLDEAVRAFFGNKVSYLAPHVESMAAIWGAGWSHWAWMIPEIRTEFRRIASREAGRAA